MFKVSDPLFSRLVLVFLVGDAQLFEGGGLPELMGITTCEFRIRKVSFLGCIIDAQGLKADPEKVKVVQQKERPRL